MSILVQASTTSAVPPHCKVLRSDPYPGHLHDVHGKLLIHAAFFLLRIYRKEHRDIQLYLPIKTMASKSLRTEYSRSLRLDIIDRQAS
jgi:hypothetical protein